MSVDPAALKDPQRFVPNHVKGIAMFPEWLEEKLRPIDDAIIEFVQFFHNPFIIVVTQCISMIYSVEVAAIIPYFLIFLGWDRAILPVLSQSVVLLILSQLPKRFIWRYRPYMVNRAKMGAVDKTSSFPARTVTCGIVFTHIINLIYNAYYDPSEKALFIFYMVLTCVYILTAILTSWSRITLGAHYPSDCLVGVFQGILSCLLGEVFNIFYSCPKQLLRASAIVPWSFDNIDYVSFLQTTLIGLVLVLISSIRFVSLWNKITLISSLLFPSLAFAKLVCTTTYPSAPEEKAYYLEDVTIFVQHYIILFGIFGCVLVSYKYLRPNKVGIAAAAYYLVFHTTLLALLMFHRLVNVVPETNDFKIENGIGDLDLN